MPRHIQIGLFVMSIILALSLLYFFNVTRDIRSATEPDVEDVPFEEPDRRLYEPTDPQIEVKLFFPGKSNDVLLRTRDTTVFASAELENRALQIVDRLIEGAGDDGLFGKLPAETQLNELFVSGGTVFLDFNSAISDNHTGGVLPEQATIYSIVNSLTYNLPEIENVKILIGGGEKETLAGHCLLLLPLKLDLSITDIASAEVVATNTN